jgi:probable HAF family extracellular repeat protein
MKTVLSRRRFLPLLATPVLVAVPLVGRPQGAEAKKRKDRHYSISDLGVLEGGDYSIGYGINPDGVVAGLSTVPGGATRAVALKDKKWRDLGQDGETSSANDINDRGDVVGFVGTAAGSNAILWKDDERIDLGSLGGSASIAYAINKSGWVVGSSAIKQGDVEVTRAFLWKDGAMADLGTLGGDFGLAQDVNDAGWVAGAATSQPGKGLYEPGTSAVLWKDGQVKALGSLGGDVSAALGINEAGWVVGGATTVAGQEYGGLGTHAFIWRDEVLYDLGTPSGADVSVANDVNKKGETVGFGGDPEPLYPTNAQQALLWEADGNLVMLNDTIDSDSGWALLTAIAINDGGRIAGLGIKDGKYRGFLLKPKN